MPEWTLAIDKCLAGLPIHPASVGELREEIAQHLEDRYRDLLSAGSDEATALAAVLEELRNPENLAAWLPPSRREPRVEPVAAGSAARGNWLADFARDLRYGSRALRKTPVLTFFAVLSLGLGIGANTTVFTIVNTLLLHPLPAADPSRLAMAYETGAKGSKQAGARLSMSYANFEDYARQQKCFRNIAASTPPMIMTLRSDAGPERMFGQFVTQSYFDTLGLRPALGRFIARRENSQPGSAPVAVLSYGVWKSRFGGSTDIVSRTLDLNNTVFTVVGVAPEGFLGVSAIFGPDVWLPSTMCERALPMELSNALSDRAKPLFRAFGRLQDGLTLPQAQAQLETVSAAIAREYPDANQGHGVSVRPLTDELFSNAGGAGGIAFGTAVLFTVVALVLGIACSNVANLLLARAAVRRQEVAVRLAIGAHRGRLIRQMLTESVLLSVVSCGAGLIVGVAGCRFVWSFVPAEVVRNMVTPRLDGSVLFFSLLVSLATAFVFGLAPALRASKTDVVTALKEETRSGGRARRAVNFANVLLVGQVAFSLVCLITAALFFRSIERAYAIDPGFEIHRLAFFMLNPSQAGYDETRTKEFYRTARDRVSALPSVEAASFASGLPFWNGPSRSLLIEGAEQRKKAESISTVMFTTDLGYFRAVGIALLKGRVFTDADREGALPVAIVNQAMAQERWPGGDALGHRFQFAGDKTWRQVVGVVKNANYTTLGEAPQPCVYVPLRQNFSAAMILYVRTAGDPAPLLPVVQREIRGLDASLDARDARTGQKLFDQILWGPRVGVSLLGVFGSLALALANVGLYGVMAYSVTQRRREIGVRTALGASPASVLRLILREGLSLVCCGILLGLGAGLLLGRVLARSLFGISSADPVSLASASIALLAVALVACYLPARSATRIDPLIALRDA